MKTALIVIDVQQALCEGEGAVWQAPALIERINGLTARARQAGVPVLFVQHESPGSPLAHGSRGWQLADGLHTTALDLRVGKSTADSFHGTGLKLRLDALGIEALVLCGMHTEFCVDTTARRALALGYPMTLPADGHGSAGNAALSAKQVVAHHNITLSHITSFGPRVRVLPSADIDFSA